MTLIIKHLEIQKVITPGKSWNDANFARLAENAWLWRVQYRAYCAHLIAHLNQSQKNKQDTEEILQTTLFLAELLESLHDRLNELPTKAKFTQDKTILKALLNQPKSHTQSNVFNFPGLVQSATFNLDTARLLTGNVRRIGIGILAFPETYGAHWTLTEYWVQFLGPILTIAGFLIYLPRTIVNGFILPKRLLENQEIPLGSRIQAHSEIDDRFFNLVNDFPSVLAGFIAVFVLAPQTLWLAAYITVAVKLAEVLFAIGKSHYDMSRLYAMRAEYNQHHHLTTLDKAFLKELDSTIAYTQGLRNVNTAQHTLLLPCLIAFTPYVIMLHPAIPVLAAIFAISLICLRFSGFRDFWITEPPPQDNLTVLSHNPRFFKSSTEERTNGQETLDTNLTF